MTSINIEKLLKNKGKSNICILVNTTTEELKQQREKLAYWTFRSFASLVKTHWFNSQIHQHKTMTPIHTSLTHLTKSIEMGYSRVDYNQKYFRFSLQIELMQNFQGLYVHQLFIYTLNVWDFLEGFNLKPIGNGLWLSEISWLKGVGDKTNWWSTWRYVHKLVRRENWLRQLNPCEPPTTSLWYHLRFQSDPT